MAELTGLPPGWNVEYKHLDGGSRPGDRVVMKLVDPTGRVRDDVSLLSIWERHESEFARPSSPAPEER